MTKHYRHQKEKIKTIEQPSKMHWHAIRRSAGSSRGRDLKCYDGTPQSHANVDITEEIVQNLHIGTPFPQGQDDAFDVVSPKSESPIGADSVHHHTISNDDDNKSTDSEEDFLSANKPTNSSGLTTFAYQRALRNRVRNARLSKHAEYDMRAYTPTFVHDCLMLPGSLANVIGKVRNSVSKPHWPE